MVNYRATTFFMETDIKAIAQKLVEHPKGILAADESVKTATKRLEAVGVESTEDSRMRYRDLFLGADGVENYLSGVILHEETLYQKNREGALFVDVLHEKGIAPGIKVDLGTVPFPGFDGEVITEGLDGLGQRLEAYRQHGALFTKWRSVIRIGEGIPTPECVHTNAVGLARYARIVQDVGMVPMVEPEVLLDGAHDLARSKEILSWVLSHVLYECERYRVDMDALILKTSMAVPGKDSGLPLASDDVANATAEVLRAAVPEYIAGVVFLSGGQTPDEATQNLSSIKGIGSFPWPVTFSYARAIQQEPLEVWKGDDANLDAAREVLHARLAKLEVAVKGEM